MNTWHVIIPHLLAILRAGLIAINRFCTVRIEEVPLDNITRTHDSRAPIVEGAEQWKELVEKLVRMFRSEKRYKIRISDAIDGTGFFNIVPALMGIREVLRVSENKSDEQIEKIDIFLFNELEDISNYFQQSMEACQEGSMFDMHFIKSSADSDFTADMSGFQRNYQLVFVRTNLHPATHTPRLTTDKHNVEMTSQLCPRVQDEAEGKSPRVAYFVKEVSGIHKSADALEQSCFDAIHCLEFEHTVNDILLGYEVQQGGLLVFFKKTSTRQGKTNEERCRTAIVNALRKHLQGLTSVSFEYLEPAPGLRIVRSLENIQRVPEVLVVNVN